MNKLIVWKLEAGSYSSSPDDVHLYELEFPDATTLDTVSKVLPGGAYTTFRTYEKRKTIKFHEHIERLESAAKLSGVDIKLNEKHLREAVRKVLSATNYPEVRVRITLDLHQEVGMIYIAAEGLFVPPALAYINGVQVITREMHRENPKAKLTNFITLADQIRAELPPEYNEVLMTEKDGHILEGLSSNFFAVKAGEIWTEDERVLPGITRSTVIEEARRANINVHLQSISLGDIPTIEEAFITSTSRGVLPVISIDHHLLANGEPGKITRKLIKCFQERIHRDLEEI